MLLWVKDLIGVGCGTSFVHNATQSASECLYNDLEINGVKIYLSFYIYSVKVEELTKFL